MPRKREDKECYLRPDSATTKDVQRKADQSIHGCVVRTHTESSVRPESAQKRRGQRVSRKGFVILIRVRRP